jgi:hypothetical protein
MDRGEARRPEAEGDGVSGAAFYCVADERFFLGAVALVNSLRLHGHREPIYLLDAGLETEQRELLAGETTLVDGPEAASPHVLKAIAPTRHPAETQVLIDTDMIATRSLAPLVERAQEGLVVAFENDRARFVPEWGELLGLGEARPGPYVSSGLVFLGGGPGRRTLELFAERLDAVDFKRTFWRANEPDYAFLYADQDVLNGVLHAALEPELLVALEHRLAPVPPFAGLRLRDAATLRCEFADGTEPYVVHHFDRKPWLVPMYHGLFSRLLARLLLGPGIAIRVPEEMVPLRMRRGPRARVERARVDVADVFRRKVLERGGRG